MRHAVYSTQRGEDGIDAVTKGHGANATSSPASFASFSP